MALKKTFNNGMVVSVVPAKAIKDLTHVDSKILHNLDMSENKKSLGVVNLFEQMGIAKVPFMKEIMMNNDYIYVNGMDGGFTYDILMDAEYPSVLQLIDEGNPYLGKDNTPFQIKTSHPFTNNDIISYDMDAPVQMYVTSDEVEDTGDGFILTVSVMSKDPEAYFPAELLKAGTRLYKIGTFMDEYNLNGWTGLSGAGTPMKQTMEFQIGSPQGVQVSYTAYGASISLNGKENSYITEQLLKQAQDVYGIQGTNLSDQYVAFAKPNEKGQVTKGGIQKVDKLLNVLAMAELYKMTASRMMYSQANTITSGNTAARVNEGLFPQLRRGHYLTYRNEVELKAMIRQGAAIAYQGVNIPVEKRMLKFKAGFRAYELVRELFKQEFISTYPMGLEQEGVPVPLLSGTDRNNLTYQTFTIGKAFLNGIGNVEIEHDPSFDYDFGDIVIRGYSGGMSKRSYSLIMWDIADKQYTNVLDSSVMPKGVTVDKMAQKKNVYIVKPDGVPEVSFGTETGRMAGRGVNSVGGHMGETFWAFSQMDAFILDLGRIILIEKEEQYNTQSTKYL